MSTHRLRLKTIKPKTFNFRVLSNSFHSQTLPINVFILPYLTRFKLFQNHDHIQNEYSFAESRTFSTLPAATTIRDFALNNTIPEPSLPPALPPKRSRSVKLSATPPPPPPPISPKPSMQQSLIHEPSAVITSTPVKTNDQDKLQSNSRKTSIVIVDKDVLAANNVSYYPLL